MDAAQRQAARGLLDMAAQRYIPPELRGLLGLVAEANPVVSMERAGTAAQGLLGRQATPMQRVGYAGDMLSNMAGVVAPAMVASRAGLPAAQALQESVMGFSRAAGIPEFIADESGALRLYHGSPHDFDRFSMDKIGTGEGAQAYGHGLYFAEAEDTARAYRDQLSRPYYVTADGADVAQKYGADVLDAFEAVGGDPAEIKDTISRLRGMVQRNLADYGASDVSQLQPEYAGDFASSTIDMARRADGLEALLKSGEVKRVNEGRMYEVEVNANPEDFLDWDKPLSEQPQKVRDFANGRWNQIFGRGPDASIEGEFIAKAASPQSDIDGRAWLETSPAADQAKRLREAGIPGIRYLDAGSRGAGDGSRNYVVFDENLISIVRKYGIAGAAALYGVSQADIAQAMNPTTDRQTGLLMAQTPPRAD